MQGIHKARDEAARWLQKPQKERSGGKCKAKNTNKPGHDGRPNPSFCCCSNSSHINKERRRRHRVCERRACSFGSLPLSLLPLCPPFLLPCKATRKATTTIHEGPARQQQLRRRRPLRRLPLLHELHVAVRRLRRRPHREEAAAERPHFFIFLGGRHDHGSERFRRREGEGRRRSGRHAGVAGAGGGGGVEADEGDQEPVPDVRRRRGRRGRGRAGDGDRVPDGRAARGAHRVGRPQQGRRRHGHGERLLPALFPLPPPPRDGHGPGGARLNPQRRYGREEIPFHRLGWVACTETMVNCIERKINSHVFVGFYCSCPCAVKVTVIWYMHLDFFLHLFGEIEHETRTVFVYMCACQLV